jgi:hypothetical protein
MTQKRNGRILNRVSTKVLRKPWGAIQPKMRNGWVDQDCQIALNTGIEARKKMLQRAARAHTLQYADARKAARAICRKKKKEHEENIFHEP